MLSVNILNRFWFFPRTRFHIFSGIATVCPVSEERIEAKIARMAKSADSPEISGAVFGSVSLGGHTDSTQQILDAATTLFDQIVDHGLLVRRMYVVANHILPAAEAAAPEETEQLDLFSLPEEMPEKPETPPEVIEREQRRQEAILRIRDKFGKNAILRGMNLEEGATARDRNQQIGGHRA